MGTSLQGAGVQVFLGLGIAISMFAVILFSMLDRIFDTIRDTIKPLARLVPLIAFVASAYRTFWPIIVSLLPQELVGAAGDNPDFIIQTVESGAFTRGVLLTLGTMLLFLLTNRALGRESAELKALRAELAKQRRASR